MYKKRILILLLLLFTLSSIVFIRTPIYALEKNLDSQDAKLIENMVTQVALDEGRKIENFTYTFKNVYYHTEEWAGYVIDFTSKKEVGYAIVFNVEGKLKIVELFFGKSSPYY